MPKIWNSGRQSGLIFIAALAFLQSLAAGVAAFATRTIFDQLHHFGKLELLPLVMLFMSGVVIACAKVLFRVVGEKLGQSYALDIRKALYTHTAKMGLSDIKNRRSGYMSLRFVGDMTAFKNWVSLGIPQLISAVIFLPVTAIVLVLLHPPIAFIILPLIILVLSAIAYFGFDMRQYHRRLRARRARIAADMVERMPLAPQLDLLGRTSTELKLIERRTNRMIRVAIQRTTRAETLKALPDIYAGLAAALVLWIGSETSASTAQIAAILATLSLTLSPLRGLATVSNYWASFYAAHNKCSEALQRKIRDQAVEITKNRLLSGPLSLEVRNLSIGPVRDLSFNLAKGECSVVDGKNGSGKSLLLSAIAGLERIGHGEILLNGKAMNTASTGSLRRGVAYLSPQSPILRGSLRRALTMGLSKRPTDAQILSKILQFRLQNLCDRIGGLDGQITEHGRNISAGELVRIACIRAALGDPGLILLDQVFSNLDSDGKVAVKQWLENTTATIISTDKDISETTRVIRIL